MADRISGGNTQAVQQRQAQETNEKSPSSQILKGRGVQKDGVSPLRQSSSPPGVKSGVKPGVKQAAGKSWKDRAAKLDGVAQRNKPSKVGVEAAARRDMRAASPTSSPTASSPKASSPTASSPKTASLSPQGRPAMPAPYKGLRTLERGATMRPDTRPALSKSGSNFFDVRRGKFKEQFQQQTQNYDRRISELKPFQKQIYQDEKNAITSLLKQNPGDALNANKQFSEITSHARAIEDMFHGDGFYLAKLAIGDW